LNKKANDKERRHLREVKNLSCVVCFKRGPSEAHHCILKGRSDHYWTIPLCVYHHRGKEGINGGIIGKKTWEERYGKQTSLLGFTYAELLTYDGCPAFVQPVGFSPRQIEQF